MFEKLKNVHVGGKAPKDSTETSADFIKIINEFGLVKQYKRIGIVDDGIFDDSISDDVIQFLCYHHRFTPEFPNRFVEIKDVATH